MISKEQLKDLIKRIMSVTGKTQEQVAIGANYEPKTLTQILSGKADKQPAFDRLKLAYKEELKNSTKLQNTPLALGDKLPTVQDFIEEIKSNKEQLLATNEYLKGLLALSLHDLSAIQKDMYAHLKGAIKRQSERFAKMDPQKVKEELGIISTYAADIRVNDGKEGSPAHS